MFSCWRRTSTLLVLLSLLFACVHATPGGSGQANDLDWTGIQFFLEGLAHNEVARMTTTPLQFGSNTIASDTDDSHDSFQPLPNMSQYALTDDMNPHSYAGMEEGDQESMFARGNSNEGYLGNAGYGTQQYSSQPGYVQPQPTYPHSESSRGHPGYAATRATQAAPTTLTFTGVALDDEILLYQGQMPYNQQDILPAGAMAPPTFPPMQGQTLPGPNTVIDQNYLQMTMDELQRINPNFQLGMATGVEDVGGWVGRQAVPGHPPIPPSDNLMTPSNDRRASLETSTQTSSTSNRRKKSELASGEHKHRCDVDYCNAGFDTKADLHHHQRSHRPYELRPYSCPTCNKRFEYEKDVRRHISSVHNPNAPRYYCPQQDCKYFDSGFKRSDHLDRHLKKTRHVDDSAYQSSGPSSHQNFQ